MRQIGDRFVVAALECHARFRMGPTQTGLDPDEVSVVGVFRFGTQALI